MGNSNGMDSNDNSFSSYLSSIGSNISSGVKNVESNLSAGEKSVASEFSSLWNGKPSKHMGMTSEQQPKHMGMASGSSIPRSHIPRGQEDQYILKSQIVPPVCPACPPVLACPGKNKCPLCPAPEPIQPCPPCARCPESPFECKKVPSYGTRDTGYISSFPRPLLNDFSQFGS